MKPGNDKLATTEVGRLRSKLAKMGVPPAVANNLITTGKDRKQATEDVKAFCRGLKKAL